MKYLIWRAKVKFLIDKRFGSADGWESWADWKEYFINGFTPDRAILRVKEIPYDNDI